MALHLVGEALDERRQRRELLGLRLDDIHEDAGEGLLGGLVAHCHGLSEARPQHAGSGRAPACTTVDISNSENPTISFAIAATCPAPGLSVTVPWSGRREG